MALTPTNPQMPAPTLGAPSLDLYPVNKIENFSLFGGFNAKVSPYLNGPHEFRDLSNLNFLFPGSLSKRPGSTLYIGVTVVGAIQNGTEFQRLNGNSYIVFGANTNLYTCSPPNTLTPVVTGLLNNGVFDFVTFADRLFCANGQNFVKFDGVNNYLFSLPPGATAVWGVSPAIGGSLLAGVTGTFVAAYGYVNERGYAGPLSNGITFTLNGVTTNSFTYYGLTQPFSGYGITSIQLWRTGIGGVDFFGTTTLVPGGTQATDTGFPLGSSIAIPHLWFTLVPRYVELYNNQLFLSGFSSMPSRTYWSEIGEPEAIQPTYYAEFRTNDGDRITGQKTYNGAMVVSKRKSLHRVIGDNPSNFSFQEITDQYGNIANQAMVVFENLLWMLDEKGIVQYDGANVEVVSSKPEPLFLGMNVPAAIDQATATHFKYYNEVWFAIPSFGSTINNKLLVYDYFSQAWTRYDGIQPSCMFPAYGTLNYKTIFYGGLSGGLFYMGQSFMGDNGNAITCMAFSRWIAPRGQTTENMFRRLWLDLDPILGVTQAISINLLTNYASNTISYTNTIMQSTFQSRLDFGLSARTLAVQMVTSSATLPFKMNAYSIESRFQRNV